MYTPIEMDFKVKCTGCKKDITADNKYTCKDCSIVTYCSESCSQKHWDQHQIGCVLIWEFPSLSIGEFIELKRDDLGLLRKALKTTGLLETLKGEGPFTVFAPTNVAVSHAQSILKDATTQEIKKILLHHVHKGILNADSIIGSGQWQMIDGQNVAYSVDERRRITLNYHIHVVQKQLIFRNGVVHIIDGVLIPSEMIPSIEK